MLHVIGLGLGDAKDVTVKGFEIIKKCDRVYLESYTSMLCVGHEDLEQFYGRPIMIADRETVESCVDEILPKLEGESVAFLVVGDPFGATTHADLVLRAKEKNIQVRVIHNASILTAVGCCGLQLYTFGETVSIPFWCDDWKPDSFYKKIISNRERGLHTLCLLDIKVKEPTLESICRKKKVYLPPRYMSVAEAATQLIAISEKTGKGENQDLDLTEESLAVGLARIGTDDQKIVFCTLGEMSETDLGPPLHCLIIPSAKPHPLELEFLNRCASSEGEFGGTANRVNDKKENKSLS